MTFQRGVVVYIEDKGKMPQEVQEIQGTCRDANRAQDQGFCLNNGREFISKVFCHFLKKHGVKRQPWTPYMPEQNKVVEQANCTIVEMVLSTTMLNALSSCFGQKR